MYTTYIGRVAGYARQEYLRTLLQQHREIPLEELSEETLGLVEDRYFPNEFELAEERLSRAVNELPLLRRRVLSMLFVEQLTAPEVAEKLGCSVNYVYNEKHRTLRKIRDMMEGDDHDQ
ncbi:MAG: sigma-70 family RNA polymerase sigma factor [Firmicutes bacterium]|nr:sigma-70 family RNA polymerase sigma factor [Bacillota bacterium]